MLKQLQHGTLRPSIGLRYGTAVVLSAAMVALTVFLNDSFIYTRYIFCFVAVIFSSAYGGLGPGILSALISLGGVSYFVVPLTQTVTHFWDEAIPGSVFALTSLVISGLVERKRKAQQDLLTLTNAMPAGIAYIDRHMRYRFGNQTYFTRYGLTPDQLYGKSVEEVLGADAYRSALPTMNRVLNGERLNVEVLSRDKDGKPLLLQAEFVPAEPVRGVIPGFYVLSLDMTERRRMEASVQASEEKYRLASDAGHVGIWDWDIAANKVTWSDKIYEFHGVKPGEFDGTVEGFSKLIHPEDAAAVHARLDDALRSGGAYRVEFRPLRPDGQLRWLSAQANVMMKEGRAVRLIGATLDVTERKRSEEKLRTTQDRQRRAIAAGKVGLWEWNFATNHVEWSDHVYTFYGLARGQFDGTVKMFGDLTHPDDRERVMIRLQDAIEGKVPYDLELRIVRPDGDVRWIWTTGDFERDASGKPLHMRGAVLDITDRRRWEESLALMNTNLEKEVAARVEQLRKKEEELFKVRKLEAIGQLAGGVAHDFNNMMTGILGITESLHASLAPDDPRREDTEAILKASERTTELTRQLLAFGRRQIVHARVIDLNAGIQDIAKLLMRLIREDIRLDLKLGDPVSIKIDLTQLQQVLINLVANARDAMPNGGTLTLATRQQNGRAVLTVSDTGTGMSPDVLQHLFEPFYTTKDVDKGTGLGLATVYGIVKQNGGDIEVKSMKDAGSTFTIYFPLSTDGSESDAPPLTVDLPRTAGGEKILLVEDEDIVRHVIAKKLRKAGYAVSVASNGQEALELARQGQLDLIITDVVMPQMNGPQVVARVRELHPRIAVLYMSGYPEDVIAHSGVLEPGIDFLEKPIVSQKITVKAREVLDKAKAQS